MMIIDSHIHCGVQNVSQPFSEIQPLLDDAGISRCCLFPPVEEIYYRHSRTFDDNETWRRCRARANGYLLELAGQHEGVYPYYFVWNDFIVEDLDQGFCGIKWHHHDGEPEYQYEDVRCRRMIEAICRRRLPIVLEEVFERTLELIELISGRTAVIIPHLGFLNGGYKRLQQAGLWEKDSVYADTALANEHEIADFLTRYGPKRLLFGSDYPFGTPWAELDKLYSMDLPEPYLERICHANILGLLDRG